jgi:hypothetical protein
MRFVLPALAAVVLAGCGYVGEPMPPLANIPSRVTDLAALQHGSHLVVEFSLPKLTTEGQGIRREPALDLRAGPAAAPFKEGEWASQARKAEPAWVKDGRARYEIPIEGFVNREVVIAVKVIGVNGKDAGWSSFFILPVVPAPDVPRSLRAESVAGGVKVAWQAKGTGFRVFRRTGEGEFEFLADAPQPGYLDTAVELGKRYDYRIQTVVRVGDKEAESEPSGDVRVTPEDRFPPQPPAGLTVLASPSSIELTWDQNPESDLAGYRIYRAAPGGDFQRIGETTGIPAFSDQKVEAGKKYRYAVSAFDRGGNESARSAPVEGALP